MMEAAIVLLIILILLIPVATVWLLLRTGALGMQLRALQVQQAALAARLAAMETAGARPREAAGPALAETPAPAEAEALKSVPVAAEEPAVTTPPPAPEPEAEPEPVPVPVAPPALAARPRGFAGIEERLMRRWLVWLGGVALALGAVFVVEYSIEQGYFGPTARVIAGVLLGLALAAAGEWTLRQKLSPLAALQPNYVPGALTAAGVVALFASFYAGYSLYHLLGGGIAFILLAVVSGAAAVLSLRQGPLIAALGLAGGYVVPAIIETEHPFYWGLLGYVLVVSAGALLLLRWRPWPWLGWVVAAGSLSWAALTLLGEATAIIRLPLGLYLIALPALLLGLVALRPESGKRPAFLWTTAILDAALMAGFVLADENGSLSLALAVALGALLAAAARRDAALDRLVWLAGALTLAVLALWQFAPGTSVADYTAYFVLPLPAALRFYLAFAGFVAACFGFGGFVALWRAPRPARWGFVSAAMPVAILVIVYWRAEHFAASLPWAGVAVLLAGALLFAVERLVPRRTEGQFNVALAAYAIAMIGATSLAVTMALRLGWLTVGLSLELPALALLYERIHVLAVRRAAVVMAAVVLVRLLLNRYALEYGAGERPFFNSLLYTYGVPWLAFLIAQRRFRRTAVDLAAFVLEGGAIALGVALVSLEIRHAVHGGTLADPHYGLLEQGLLTDAWLAIAYGLMRRAGGAEAPIRAAAWRILALAASANLLVYSVLTSNPLFKDTPVDAVELFITYAVPAVLGALFWRALRPMPGFALAAGAAALATGFLYISLEVRHFFAGDRLTATSASNGEWYAYSAAWLVYGLAIIAAGIVWRNTTLRIAGLAIGAVVAMKVFLFDMAALSGLYRAASFLGLGLSLVALGYVYQRLLPGGPGRTDPARPSA
jgi:uncharacterized membrane protein